MWKGHFKSKLAKETICISEACWQKQINWFNSPDWTQPSLYAARILCWLYSVNQSESIRHLHTSAHQILLQDQHLAPPPPPILTEVGPVPGELLRISPSQCDWWFVGFVLYVTACRNKKKEMTSLQLFRQAEAGRGCGESLLLNSFFHLLSCSALYGIFHISVFKMHIYVEDSVLFIQVTTNVSGLWI